MATKKTASGKKSASAKTAVAKTPVKKAAVAKTSVKKAAVAKKAPVKSAGKKAAPAKASGTKAVKKSAALKTKTATAKVAASVVKKAPAKTAKAAKSITNDPSLQLADAVVNSILEKKGEKIVCLDLRNIENAVCSFFIICEGNSDTQVEAIADSVEFNVKKQTGQRPYRSEGWENALWILIDYIDVVVHVFERETRAFYNLERLWADAGEIKYSPKGERLN
ncbi:MAG: ribosome silencing factor [Bacteroidota bacterium]|jgi:ribosome-associated protein